MIRKTLLACVGLLVFSGFGSCLEGQSCTEMGCVNELMIHFDPPLTANGAYEVAIDLDGHLVDCALTVPPSSQDACFDPFVTIGNSTQTATIHDADSSSVTVRELPGISRIRIEYQTPQRVQVTVSRDGQEILRQEIAPAYESFSPNGPACGVPCLQGTHRIQTN